jgi:leucyl-tRNA synthetase
VRLLSPFVPHITHELWAHLGYSTALINEAWPETDESALTRDELEMVVQVNGKLRASITVPADASKDDCESAALASADVQKHIDGLKVFKVIVVPGRLVNIVAK